MSAYNAEKYILEAIKSILTQTYPHFELIIINDGSKDNTLEIIKKHQLQDQRIIIDDHENMGVARSVNHVVENLAKFEIIARVDADDVMLPHRLERQIKFLEDNPEVTMTSGYCHLINEHGKIIGIQKLPGFESVEACKKSLLQYREPVICAQTSLMFYKKDFLAVGGYRHIWPSEDVDLFTRMVENGSILVSPPEILMKYRVHSQSVMANRSMREKNQSSWVVNCMARRRQGLEELTFGEYLNVVSKDSFLKKLNRKRQYYGYQYYRNAGIAQGSKQYFRFIKYLIPAVLLRPIYVFNKLIFQLRNR
jgi:glycosyltransferase involved in cell wall biosynthesis